MSRERDRIARKREENPILECNKIQKSFIRNCFINLERQQIQDIAVTFPIIVLFSTLNDVTFFTLKGADIA